MFSFLPELWNIKKRLYWVIWDQREIFFVMKCYTYYQIEGGGRDITQASLRW